MKTTLSALALATVFAVPAQAFDPSAMTDAEKAAFESAVRGYLLENPEVLIEAMGVLEEREAAQRAVADEQMVMTHSDALLAGDSWVGGNPDGDITIVEFVDYRCGYCKKAHPEIAELITSDGNIRIIRKEYPILSEGSVLGARFTLAVRALEGDDTYALASDTLMQARGDITPASLEALSGQLGLDWAAVQTQMDADETNAQLAANRDLGKSLQINGTPSFIVGGQMVRGYVPLEQMRQIVAEERG